MLGRGVGLVELLERARDRALGHDAVAHWHRDELTWEVESAEDAQQAAQAVADEVCLLALGGQFRWACCVASLDDVYVPMPLRDDLQELDWCPAWVAFSQAVDLAERIDSYLAVMQADRRTAALAHDCRGELNLLGVLADLCEDLTLPHAAAEARHLHDLLRWT